MKALNDLIFSLNKKGSLRRRFVANVFWSITGMLISRGLAFAATVVVARLLGITVYGEMGIVLSTVNMFGVFAGFGLGLTATKHVAEFRRSDPARAGRIIGVSGLFASITGALMAGCMFIFSSWLAVHTLNAPHLAGVLRIGALMLFISALNGAQTGALSGLEAFKTIARVNLFTGLVSFPMLVCGAWLGGLNGAVWALAINLGFNWLLNHRALRDEARLRSIPFTFRQCGRELPVLWRFSLPAVVGGIMVSPAIWACNSLLVNRPGGYDEMGIMTAALAFHGMMLFLGNTLSAPLLSMISHAGPQAPRRLGTVNILSSWILGVTAAIPLLCFPEIAQAIFGKSYATYGFKVTFSFVVLYTTITMFKSGMSRVLAAENLLWWGVFSNAVWAVILIASAVSLVKWGAPGLAISFTIAYVLNTIVLFPLYSRKKLVPKDMLFSAESALIWAILFALALCNVTNCSLQLRAIAFIPCILLAGYAFVRLTRAENRPRDTAMTDDQRTLA